MDAVQRAQTAEELEHVNAQMRSALAGIRHILSFSHAAPAAMPETGVGEGDADEVRRLRTFIVAIDALITEALIPATGASNGAPEDDDTVDEARDEAEVLRGALRMLQGAVGVLL